MNEAKHWTSAPSCSPPMPVCSATAADFLSTVQKPVAPLACGTNTNVVGVEMPPHSWSSKSESIVGAVIFINQK